MACKKELSQAFVIPNKFSIHFSFPPGALKAFESLGKEIVVS